jgi:inner membrane protein
MDNLCHTLVGAALAESGLRRRTPLATAALLVGANLPDVDALAYFWGPQVALGIRRGWTHGVLALAVWPFALAGILLAWDRWVRRRWHPDAAPARPRALLLVGALGIFTHPLLDYLNSYGLRWLMPFRDVWYYGDVLFIVDPWIWLALAAGVLWARALRRRGRPRPELPARLALAAVAVYILLLAGSQLHARALVRERLAASGLAAARVMAGPLPATPLRRQVVADMGARYLLSEVDWRQTPAFPAGPEAGVEKGAERPGVAAAAKTRDGRLFLHWARFPFFQVEERPGEYVVHMIDARYTTHPDAIFGALTVRVPRSAADPGGRAAHHPAGRAAPSPGTARASPGIR